MKFMNSCITLLAVFYSQADIHGVTAFSSVATGSSTLDRVQQWSKSSPVIDAAFDVLCEGGTVLCPTLVGYSLFALDGEEGMAKLDHVKGRENKPYGIIGSEATFSRVFNGRKAPFLKNDFCSDTFISFVSSESVSKEALEQLRVSRAVGPSDEVAMWINSGPVFDTLIDKVETKYEGKRLILVTSGNLSGQGNPKSSTFCIDAVDKEIRDRVDMVIDIPHWSDPELDEHGRWYSAPMFDIDKGAFRRVGKNMEQVNVIVSLFNEMDKDGSNEIDLGEFKAFFKSGRFGNDIASLSEEEFVAMFQMIDEDGSGEIDLEEMYSFLSNHSHTEPESRTLSNILLESASTLPLL